MPARTEWIAQALTPGVALTAVIFYNTSLQNRFIHITGRVRELNREARQLQEQNPERHRERLRSLRWQVDLMSRRALIIRRAVLTLYAGFLSFIVTILLLAAGTWFDAKPLRAAPVISLGLGFVGLVGAAVLSIIEMYLGQRTVWEDIRTSYAEPREAALRDAPRGPSRSA